MRERGSGKVVIVSSVGGGITVFTSTLLEPTSLRTQALHIAFWHAIHSSLCIPVHAAAVNIISRARCMPFQVTNTCHDAQQSATADDDERINLNNYSGMRSADGMSKAAVACLAKQLAAANTHSGVDVFCICPGATDTPMFQASSLNHLSPEARSAFKSNLAQGRLIPPQEIAQQIVFLCRWACCQRRDILVACGFNDKYTAV